MFGLLVKEECMCTPHEYKTMKYPYSISISDSDRACRVLQLRVSFILVNLFCCFKITGIYRRYALKDILMQIDLIFTEHFEVLLKY